MEGLNTCLFLAPPLPLVAKVAALSPSTPTRTTFSGCLSPEICRFHPHMHPSSHPAVSHTSFTHPTHLSTQTYPPSIHPSTYIQLPILTSYLHNEEADSEHSRDSHQQPGWHPGDFFNGISEGLPASLGATGICFGELGAKEIHLSVTDLHLPSSQGLIFIYTP